MNGHAAVNGYADMLVYCTHWRPVLDTSQTDVSSTDHISNTRVRNLRHTSDYIVGDFVRRTIYSTLSRERICSLRTVSEKDVKSGEDTTLGSVGQTATTHALYGLRRPTSVLALSNFSMGRVCVSRDWQVR